MTKNNLVRFCPGCGSVGEVENKYRDCCPDGAKARMIPADLAEHCHNLFQIALRGITDSTTLHWINPNDKTQARYLPHIGEPVLFCHDGVTYYGKHTGGSFQTGNGVTARSFNTWECQWMPMPVAAPRFRSETPKLHRAGSFSSD